MKNLKEKALQLLSTLIIITIFPYSDQCRSDRDCYHLPRHYCLKGVWQCVSGYKPIESYYPYNSFIEYQFCVEPDNCYTVYCLRESEGFSSVANSDDKSNIRGLIFYLTLLSILIFGLVGVCCFPKAEEEHPMRVWSHRLGLERSESQATESIALQWIRWIVRLWSTSLLSRTGHRSNLYMDAPTLVVNFSEPNGDSSLLNVVVQEHSLRTLDSSCITANHAENINISNHLGTILDLPPSYDESTRQETHQEIHQVTHQQETPFSSHGQHQDLEQPPPYDSLILERRKFKQ